MRKLFKDSNWPGRNDSDSLFSFMLGNKIYSFWESSFSNNMWPWYLIPVSAWWKDIDIINTTNLWLLKFAPPKKPLLLCLSASYHDHSSRFCFWITSSIGCHYGWSTTVTPGWPITETSMTLYKTEYRKVHSKTKHKRSWKISPWKVSRFRVWRFVRDSYRFEKKNTALYDKQYI